MTAGAGQSEHPVLAADEDAAALAVARAFEQAGDLLPVLELVEQLAHPLEVGGGGLVDQVGLAADDQHRPLRRVLAPGGEARCDQLGGGGVDRLAPLGDFGASRASASAERQAGEAGADVIADLVEPRPGARPGGELDDAVLDAAVGADQHGQRPPGDKRHEAQAA